MSFKLDNIKSTNFKVSLLYAMKYSPKIKKLTIRDRQQFSFLYINKGTYFYKFSSGSFYAKEGDIIFLPKGSKYSYEILSDATNCYQIEFQIDYDLIFFKKEPQIVYSGAEYKDIFKSIIINNSINSVKSYFESQSNIYKLCMLIPVYYENQTHSELKISPAIEYIEKNYYKKINTETLAKLCYLSASQLRRIFEKELNTTPIKLKNEIRIEHAKRMILHTSKNFSEISETLGFDNVYAFSNMFKKHVGLSPTQFSKNTVEKITNDN